MKNSIKIRVFFGFIILIVLCILLMLGVLMLGADNAGNTVMWLAVLVSIMWMGSASYLAKG